MLATLSFEPAKARLAQPHGQRTDETSSSCETMKFIRVFLLLEAVERKKKPVHLDGLEGIQLASGSLEAGCFSMMVFFFVQVVLGLRFPLLRLFFDFSASHGHLGLGFRDLPFGFVQGSFPDRPHRNDATTANGYD